MSADEYQISMAGGDGDPLDAIEARVNAATEGPWNILPSAMPNAEMVTRYNADSGIAGFTELIADNIDPTDAEFIAHARTDVPALLGLARKQAATLAAVLELANARGRCGWSISSDEIRKALKA